MLLEVVDDMKLPLLKGHLKKLGERATGNKPELVDRLRGALTANPEYCNYCSAHILGSAWAC